MQTLINFFGTNDFLPHGYCLKWGSQLLWLHVVSDVIIMLAYYFIPLALLYFMYQRKNFPYPWLIAMFGAFIVACGTTHLISVITIWIPIYWLDGYLKALTAVLSIITAFAMVRIIPLALQLPSAEQLQAQIDEKILAQKALDIAYQELQQNHQQLQVAQTQLVQAEKMAALGTLVAGVAHEINNPVNFLHLGTHNLREGLGKQKQFLLPLLEEEHAIIDILKQQYSQFDSSLENIEEGCIRIKTIVDDLRTFSRLDEADRKTVNLIASLESTIRITQTQYQKNVQIITDFKAQPGLECWSAKLNQVFMNIIVNACHAIEKQQETDETLQGLLTISSFELEQNERNELAIRFQDNGCGMNEEVKNKIFEPFFTTKPVGQGTGLGMSLSYGIIQEHNGRIDVESHIGQGTIITIYLPLSA